MALAKAGEVILAWCLLKSSARQQIINWTMQYCKLKTNLIILWDASRYLLYNLGVDLKSGLKCHKSSYCSEREDKRIFVACSFARCSFPPPVLLSLRFLGKKLFFFVLPIKCFSIVWESQCTSDFVWHYWKTNWPIRSPGEQNILH